MKLNTHWMNSTAAAVALLGWVGMHPVIADEQAVAVDNDHRIALHYSDGSPPDYGIDAVNRRLMEVGVRVSRVAIPKDAKPILRQSVSRPLSPEESEELIRHFHLDRRALLHEIRSAGRMPEMHRGGYLQTSEHGVPPYPKVYDMQALDRETTAFLQRKFGKLHVNSSEAGVGIDEVMTIVSGGPYTWFFVFGDNVVGKLRFGKVDEHGEAWRISYPGLVPHGGYFDAPHGLVVAYAHGPEHFVMRYADTSVQGYETLGDNPWIDFSTAVPMLRERLTPDAIVSANR